MSKPESETAPWANYEALRSAASLSGAGLYQIVDAARAAEAAQHQQDIDIAHGALLGVEQAVLGFERAGDDPDGAIVMALIAKREATDLHTRLAAVEAERDQHAEQVERTSTLLLNISDTLRSRGFNARTALDERVIALAQERDRLKAALDVIDSRYYLADIDSDILRDALGKPRRAALTPQGQSTDGETR